MRPGSAVVRHGHQHGKARHMRESLAPRQTQARQQKMEHISGSETAMRFLAEGIATLATHPNDKVAHDHLKLLRTQSYPKAAPEALQERTVALHFGFNH